jgi:uncharacterized protein YhdP
MKVLLNHICKYFVLSIASFIILVALMVSGARIVTPYFSETKNADYTVILQDWLSKKIQYPVRLGKIQVTWDGFEPIVQLQNLVILEKDKVQALLRIDKLSLTIDLFASLLNRELHTDHLLVTGMDLAFEQLPNGNIVINQIPLPKNSGAFKNWLFSQKKIDFQNLALHWNGLNGQIVDFPDVYLSLRQTIFNVYRLQFDAEQIAWKNKNSSVKGISIPRFSGKGVLKPQLIGWNLLLDPVELQVEEHTWPATQVSLQINPDVQVLQISFLSLEDIKRSVINSGFFNPQIENLLNQIKPEGNLSQVVIEHQGKLDEALSVESMVSQLQIETDFAQVNTIQNKQWPAVSNLAGHLSWSNDAILLALTARDTQLHLPFVSTKPLLFHSLEGQVNWQKEETGWSINTEHLHTEIPGMNLNTDMHLQVPHQGSPEINLVAHFDGHDLAGVKDYIPHGILVANKGLNKWVREVRLQAKSIKGTMVLKGPVKDFPFDKQQGHFGLHMQLEGAHFKYLDAWPSIQQLHATLNFSNRKMVAEIDSAQTDNLQVKNSTIKIDDLQHPQLNIQTTADASIAHIIKFLNETPLRKYFNDLMQAQLQGTAKIALQILVPLGAQTPATQVKGKTILQQAGIFFPEWQFLLNKINGEINFTEQEISAKNLKAQTLGQTISLGIRRNKEEPLTFDAQAEKFRIFNQTLRNFNLQLQPQAEQWGVTLNSDTIEGHVDFPRDKQKTIFGNFSKLYLQTLQSKNKWVINPASIPPLHIESSDFKYNDYRLGRILIDIAPHNRGLYL